MINRLTYLIPDELETSLSEQLDDFQKSDAVNGIWKKDAALWTDSGEDKWLGWLDIVEKEFSEIDKYPELADDLHRADFQNIVLLGMGGSSLCTEVFSITFGKKNFHILDSTVPAQIKHLEARINVATTLFVVASKSGSTLEPNTFKQHFYKLVCDAVGEDQAGKHFVAITDPGSKLEAVAEADRFRHVFYGEPTVGGRFSALSVFGMIPAAAMGIDVKRFLKTSLEMVEACRGEIVGENPGFLLGTLMGICHKAGRDKLTVFTSCGLSDVGAWLEQLVAESTGKEGVSIIPIDREPALNPADYGDDRLFVFLTVAGDSGLDSFTSEIKAAGHPVVTIELEDIQSLGQEFFRWEFATAVAGAVMGINPFDQPDVESAKIEAKKITEAYEATGILPADEPFHAVEGIAFYGDAGISKSVEEADSAEVTIAKHLARIVPNDYFALLAYIEMTEATEKLLQGIRETVLRKYNVATCIGFGPRFLHSTGQAYKGGAPNGVFLQITSDDAFDFEVPGQKYTFGIVKAAQSRGDFQVLIDRERRALRLHIGSDVISGLRMVNDLISGC